MKVVRVFHVSAFAGEADARLDVTPDVTSGPNPRAESLIGACRSFRGITEARWASEKAASLVMRHLPVTQTVPVLSSPDVVQISNELRCDDASHVCISLHTHVTSCSCVVLTGTLEYA